MGTVHPLLYFCIRFLSPLFVGPTNVCHTGICHESRSAALLCAGCKSDHLYTARELTSLLMNSGISDLLYTDSYQTKYLFSRLHLPSLLASFPKPQLTCQSASLHYVEGSRGQYRFSFLLKNSGADASDVSFDAGCSIPGAQILPDQDRKSVV